MNLMFFSIASLSYRIFFESKPFVFFPHIVNVRTFFEFTQSECHAGYFGDLAPFLWRAKQMICVTLSLDQLTAASSNFSVSMEAG